MQQEYELLQEEDDSHTHSSVSSPSRYIPQVLTRLSPGSRTKNGHDSSRCTSTALFVMTLCTLSNLALWWNSSVHFRSKASLEEPTTYMGLETLEYNTSLEAKLFFRNFPILLTQISKKEPDRFVEDDVVRKLTSIGTVSPDTRHFIVTSEISSIAQFRVVDFGYENCSIHVSLESTFPLGLSVNETLVDVWALDEKDRLQPMDISWTSRPPRKELLQMIELKPHISTTIFRSWRCEWGSIQTFEFACAQKATQCSVDFWQSPRNPELGVTMLQRSSLL